LNNSKLQTGGPDYYPQEEYQALDEPEKLTESMTSSDEPIKGFSFFKFKKIHFQKIKNAT
jgi:hypothetical protein